MINLMLSGSLLYLFSHLFSAASYEERGKGDALYEAFLCLRQAANQLQ